MEKVYIITNERAIAFEGASETTIRIYPPEQLGDVHRRENNDGTGDVLISMRYWEDMDGNEQKEDIGFMAIQNPKAVEKMLKDLAERKSA